MQPTQVPQERIEHCRSCGATIVWVKMTSGKFSPFNVEDGVRTVTHFATCPQSADWRKSL